MKNKMFGVTAALFGLAMSSGINITYVPILIHTNNNDSKNSYDQKKNGSLTIDICHIFSFSTQYIQCTRLRLI